METNIYQIVNQLTIPYARLKSKINSTDPAYLLIVLGCVWGSSFILIKNILPCFSPVQYALMRIIITGTCFLPWFFSSIKKVTRQQWYWLVLLGLMGYFFSYLLMGLSQTHIDSSLAGILASLSPLATFIVGISFFQQEFRWKNFWGIALGLLGCLVLILFDRTHHNIDVGYYSLFMIGSIILSAFTINITQKHLHGLSPYIISSISFGSMTLPALLIFLLVTDWSALNQDVNLVSCSLAVLCLAVIGTVMGSLMYFHIINRSGALYTSTVTYIMPIVAILLGMLDGELIHINSVVGLAFIIGGIKLIRST